MAESTLKTWDDDAYGPFVDESSGPLDDLVTSLLDEPDTAREYLRTTFLSDVMSELRRLRIELGVTQAELGERLGAHQSAIARMERRDDISLSKLWDYLYALGMTPFALEWGSFAKVVECVRLDPGHRMTSDHFHSRFEPEFKHEAVGQFLHAVSNDARGSMRRLGQLTATTGDPDRSGPLLELFELTQNAKSPDSRPRGDVDALNQRVAPRALNYSLDGNAITREVRRG